jgi:hypothetical protein
VNYFGDVSDNNEGVAVHFGFEHSFAGFGGFYALGRG